MKYLSIVVTILVILAVSVIFYVVFSSSNEKYVEVNVQEPVRENIVGEIVPTLPCVDSKCA